MSYFNFAFWCAVTAVYLKQTVLVDGDLLIRAYYAGHVWFKLFTLFAQTFPFELKFKMAFSGAYIIFHLFGISNSLFNSTYISEADADC